MYACVGKYYVITAHMYKCHIIYSCPPWCMHVACTYANELRHSARIMKITHTRAGAHGLGLLAANPCAVARVEASSEGRCGGRHQHVGRHGSQIAIGARTQPGALSLMTVFLFD